MCAEDDGCARRAKFQDGGADDFQIDWVESGERFVKNEQLGPGDDGGDELDLLRHALGERLDFLVGPLGEPHFGEPLPNLPGGVRALHALECGVIGKDAADGHLLVEAALFGQVADAVVSRARAALAEHFHLAGVRVEDVQDGADGRGLAGAVGADEAVGAAGWDFERELVDRRVLAEGLGDVGQPDGGALWFGWERRGHRPAISWRLGMVGKAKGGKLHVGRHLCHPVRTRGGDQRLPLSTCGRPVNLK